MKARWLILNYNYLETLMNSFLVDINYDDQYRCYQAFYSNGQSVELAANSYEDAICEAYQIEVD